MSAPWTPGPWHYHRNVSYWEFGNDTCGQIGDVCAMKFDGKGELDNEDEQEATARLIAAAPDLAEAVKMGAKDLLTATSWVPEEYQAALGETVRQMHIALAKAKGEAP